mgnify:CR=1 FL=1
MNNHIKISIIVPVYNVEKYLSKCLNSLINQTLKEIEIICINDGSTDSCNKILENFKSTDSRIIVINQKNQGVSVARNNGLEIAKGEYISFVDSDDWIDEDFCEKLYNSAKKYNADIAVCGVIKINEKYKQPILHFEQEDILQNIEEKLIACDIPDKSYSCNKIYKKDALDKSGVRFTPNIVYEDMIFTPKILYYSDKLVTVPDTYYYYYRHKNSLVKSKNKKSESDYLYSRKILTEFFKEKNIYIERFSTKIKKYGILGLTIYKTKTKNNKTEHTLFNIIKW